MGTPQSISRIIQKRAAPTVLVLLLVVAGKAGSAAIGTTALLVGDKNFKELSAKIDIDLGHLENSLSRLESEADSLAEVV